MLALYSFIFLQRIVDLNRNLKTEIVPWLSFLLLSSVTILLGAAESSRPIEARLLQLSVPRSSQPVTSLSMLFFIGAHAAHVFAL